MPEMLPKSLEALLKKDSALHSDVLNVFSQFEGFFDHIQQRLFPEYTDHGPRHIHRVLEAAWDLSTTPAKKRLTPEDAALLALSVLLHDLAMHFTPGSFRSLMRRPEWDAKWKHFLYYVQRLEDEKKLTFGAETKLTNIDLEKNEGFPVILAGEFLRKQHADLALLIAEEGMPVEIVEPIKLEVKTPKLLKLAGLIARSHGISLRKAADGLKGDSQEDLSAWRESHPVFLMALLRIADAFDIDPNRAGELAAKAIGIKNAQSEREWKKHQAIDHCKLDNTESFVIQTCPKKVDLQVLLDLQDLFAYLQAELDQTWAVLGETYGSQKDLDQLRLRVRRVRSDLDKDRLEKTPDRFPFIPERIQLRTSGVDLMKLMVEPLYGKNPAIGVRELLQNSLDAVRERERFEQRHGVQPKARFYDIEADILISLEEEAPDQWALVVTDKGIGMSLEVIRDYFLVAGASFRKSETWAAENKDEKGQSQVMRTGKFGIGVFAAFLLGDQIEVQTRSLMGDSQGYHFQVHFSETALTLEKNNDLPLGTQIKISLSRDSPEGLLSVYESRNWDWYGYQKPQVTRRVRFFNETQRNKWAARTYFSAYRFAEGLETVLPLEFALQPEALDETWINLEQSACEAVNWTYEWSRNRTYERGRKSFLNGIRFNYGLELRIRGSIRFQGPQLLIEDLQGSLPITVLRDNFSQKPAFWGLLEAEVSKWYLAGMLLFGLEAVKRAPPNYLFSIAKLIESDATYSHSGFRLDNGDPGPKMLTFYGDEQLRFGRLLTEKWDKSYLRFQNLHDIDRNMKRISKVRSYIPQEVLSQNYAWANRLANLQAAESLPPDPDWDQLLAMVRSGELPDHMTYVLEYPTPKEIEEQKIEAQGPLLDLWNDLIGEGNWLPYDLEERKQRFPKAFQELAFYIAYHERMEARHKKEQPESSGD
ncbi:MAG: hypothetical protein A2527_13735 [Candidatus Lambdaproteobacteria bacterium RIFOXYD2_FULL_50_16]|uniref:HD-CE domain-containing protein n=1 Tax=Candidatus Lambdaproteobacteria bacterium RIFOXYD2_FULL_50_16 TaxID=1817772 RepID=A0A1F6G5A5_9PROT|nr:MAG: hypothetical protein A2527_13735 [Candidatus Lambdaproteobacteria bacterium RIFOXYD2_FULL_50_16]